MIRIGDYSFSPLARYVAPEGDGTNAPLTFRPGSTRFPSIGFWRGRYGYADRSMQPQFAEWLAQDFQELEAYRFGLCIRVLDYLYEEPLGGSADEREAVLSELDALVAAGEILQLRVCVVQPQYRHYRLQFFRDHMATDLGFWHRLALVYARLAAGAVGTASAPPQSVWCHALLEEARGFQCPAFTPELIVALVAIGPPELAKISIATSGAGDRGNETSALPPELVSAVVEIPNAQQMPAKESHVEPPPCAEADVASTVNVVIPESQIAIQRSDSSDLAVVSANKASPHEYFELETDTQPSVLWMPFVWMTDSRSPPEEFRI